MGERRQVARLHRDMPRSVQRRYSCNGVGCSPTQHDPARPSKAASSSTLLAAPTLTGSTPRFAAARMQQPPLHAPLFANGPPSQKCRGLAVWPE